MVWLTSSATFAMIACWATSRGGGLRTEGTLNFVFNLANFDFLGMYQQVTGISEL